MQHKKKLSKLIDNENKYVYNYNKEGVTPIELFELGTNLKYNNHLWLFQFVQFMDYYHETPLHKLLKPWKLLEYETYKAFVVVRYSQLW